MERNKFTLALSGEQIETLAESLHGMNCVAKKNLLHTVDPVVAENINQRIAMRKALAEEVLKQAAVGEDKKRRMLEQEVVLGHILNEANGKTNHVEVKIHAES